MRFYCMNNERNKNTDREERYKRTQGIDCPYCTPKERCADNPKITCLNCKHLMFSDMYGECKIQLRIVNPSDTCEYAEKRIDDLDNPTEKCGSCEWAMPVKGTINEVKY